MDGVRIGSSDFWRKWAASEPIERIDLVKELPITKTYAQFYYPRLDNQGSLEVVATMLNSYFEDLLDAVQEGPVCKKLN
jgi:hypothetical protein